MPGYWEQIRQWALAKVCYMVGTHDGPEQYTALHYLTPLVIQTCKKLLYIKDHVILVCIQSTVNSLRWMWSQSAQMGRH